MSISLDGTQKLLGHMHQHPFFTERCVDLNIVGRDICVPTGLLNRSLLTDLTHFKG